MSDLKQELCNFEGSDALGVGDFSVCLRAAARIAELEAALEEVRPLVIGASHSEARYPKARAALEGKKDE